MSYRDHVSDESLDIIRANECDAPINLATKRFRRLWNEIESLRARLDEAANDAQRYVWWCDPSNDIPPLCSTRASR